MREGVLPVDKPAGPTSHDVVAMTRRALGTRRIGHTGTLDPFASGLLLLCIGRATRIAEYLTGLDKSYIAVARLGEQTTTDDSTGETVLESEGWSELDAERIDRALDAQRGRVTQTPPAYSAKKVAGERMYARARRGDEVVVAPVEVRIDRIEIRALRLPDVELEVDCSSGTYVRAIARDLGMALGVGAHLTSLRRTRVGGFGVADALAVKHLADAARVERAMIPPLKALAHLPEVRVDGPAASALAQGRGVPCAEAPDAATVAVEHRGALHAIGVVQAGVLRPRKVFADA